MIRFFVDWRVFIATLAFAAVGLSSPAKNYPTPAWDFVQRLAKRAADYGIDTAQKVALGTACAQDPATCIWAIKEIKGKEFDEAKQNGTLRDFVLHEAYDALDAVKEGPSLAPGFLDLLNVVDDAVDTWVDMKEKAAAAGQQAQADAESKIPKKVASKSGSAALDNSALQAVKDYLAHFPIKLQPLPENSNGSDKDGAELDKALNENITREMGADNPYLPDFLIHSTRDSVSTDSQLLQLRRDAARAEQMLQDAQAAFDAQKTAVDAQQAAIQLDQQDSQLPNGRDLSMPNVRPNSRQDQTTARVADPIEGYWVITGNSGGCDYIEGISGVGYGGRIVRLGTGTFTLSGGIITKTAPGTYFSRHSGPDPVQNWEGIIRVSGSTMQVTETIHYVAQKYGIVGGSVISVGSRNQVCTGLITLRKQ